MGLLVFFVFVLVVHVGIIQPVRRFFSVVFAIKFFEVIRHMGKCGHALLCFGDRKSGRIQCLQLLIRNISHLARPARPHRCEKAAFTDGCLLFEFFIARELFQAVIPRHQLGTRQEWWTGYLAAWALWAPQTFPRHSLLPVCCFS